MSNRISKEAGVRTSLQPFFLSFHFSRIFLNFLVAFFETNCRGQEQPCGWTHLRSPMRANRLRACAPEYNRGGSAAGLNWGKNDYISRFGLKNIAQSVLCHWLIPLNCSNAPARFLLALCADGHRSQSVNHTLLNFSDFSALTVCAPLVLCYTRARHFFTQSWFPHKHELGGSQ